MAELISGKTARLNPLVRRILAPNAGPFTGPGTNTYLVGNKYVAVIDPGPAIEKHIDAIVDEAGEAIRWILVTHTHVDHSPAALLLKERLPQDVELIGMPSNAEGFSHDGDFEPDVLFVHDQQLSTEEFSLTALHTPGHASNHLCFYLESQRLLFSGDHIMEGSTVVIAPPDGNMLNYLASLELLQNYDLAAIAPAHGHVIDNPHEIVAHTISHRLARESKVVLGLQSNPGVDLPALTAVVYDDVPVFMHPAAQQSLLAHLLKLKHEAAVVEEQGAWTLL